MSWQEKGKGGGKGKKRVQRRTEGWKGRNGVEAIERGQRKVGSCQLGGIEERKEEERKREGGRERSRV